MNGGLWCSPVAKTSRPTSSAFWAMAIVALIRSFSVGVRPVVGSVVTSPTVNIPNCMCPNSSMIDDSIIPNVGGRSPIPGRGRGRWSGSMSRVSSWDGVAEAYRTSFATMCEGTVPRLLSDAPGGHHLDVGSGTGALAAAAAARGRTVAAVDADPQMVALSRRPLPGSVLQAALPELPFGSATFDAVTANFVVNHVADTRAGVRELRRVTRPGGRVALTIWTSGTPQWATLVAEAFGAAGVVPLPDQRLSPELDFARSVEGLGGLASSA